MADRDSNPHPPATEGGGERTHETNDPANRANSTNNDRIDTVVTSAPVEIKAKEIRDLRIYTQCPPGNVDAEEHSTHFQEHCKTYYRKIRDLLVSAVSANSKAEPTKNVLEMNDYDDRIPANADTFFGRDLGEISMLQIHDPVNNKPTRHAMVLGEAGAGKTTLSLKYFVAAKKGKIKLFKNFKLIHYVDAVHLQNDFPSTAFGLLFTQQMARFTDTQLSREEEEAGLEWVYENQEKVLIIIDGLDQCQAQIVSKTYPFLHHRHPGKSHTILANIMAGHIWGKAHILTTSRWSVFWKLHIKPDKVIGLRGFDDANMKEAVSHHITDTTKRAAFLEQLDEAAGLPKLHALCRNPLFLRYAANTYKFGTRHLPDTISGLMSAFVLQFSRVNLYLSDITKLAHFGMTKNCFKFSASSLEELGVKVKANEDFLKEGRHVISSLESAEAGEPIYQFSDQAMQEYFAALNIVNMDESDAKEYVETTLNDSHMEMTRRLLYGVILNDETTRVMRRYLQNRTCSIEKCREILNNQLIAMISDGVIRDVRLITLLHECGEETVGRLKDRIHSIHMDVVNLLPSDQLILASMIKQCAPLDEVYLREFWLNPNLLKALYDCQKFVTVFQVGFETESTIERKHINDVMSLFDKTKLLFVMLHSGDDVKNEFLKRWIKKNEVDFGSIGLLNVNSVETLNLFFKVHDIAEFYELKLGFSEELAKMITTPGTVINPGTKKISCIRISDKSPTKERIQAYIKILDLVRGDDLAFFSCNLTDEHLRHTAQFCKDHDIKLTRIRIWDNTLEKGTLQELAFLMETTDCKSILFTRCELDAKKLEAFGEKCKELHHLHIKCKDMDEEEYSGVAYTLKATSCPELSLDDCGLTKAKLVNLRHGCEKHRVKLKTINIWDSSMDAGVYPEIAFLVRETECQNLYFGNCGLTENKLQAFTQRCVEEGVTIHQLSIKDRLTRREQRGPNFTHLHGYKINEEIPLQYPETLDNLPEILTRMEKTDEVISAVCDMMRFVVEKIEIFGWIINKIARQKLKSELHNPESKAKALKLPNEKCIHKIEMEEKKSTHEIGPEGGCVEAEDCFVEFQAGTFVKETEVVITAVMNSSPIPDEYDPISPILDVKFGQHDGKLSKPAIVRLSTWAIAAEDEESLEIEVMRFADSKWEVIHKCELRSARFIEFECSQFSLLRALLHKVKSKSAKFVFCPTMVHCGRQFVIAFVLDEKSVRMKFESNMRTFFNDSNPVKRKPYDEVYLKKKEKAVFRIGCQTPEASFFPEGDFEATIDSSTLLRGSAKTERVIQTQHQRGMDCIITTEVKKKIPGENSEGQRNQDPSYDEVVLLTRGAFEQYIDGGCHTS